MNAVFNRASAGPLVCFFVIRKAQRNLVRGRGFGSTRWWLGGACCTLCGCQSLLDLDNYSFSAGGAGGSAGSLAAGAAGMATQTTGTGGLKGSPEIGPMVGDASTGLEGHLTEGTGGTRGAGGHVTPETPFPVGGGSGVEPPDAAPAHDELDACAPRLLYRDRDGDGYGSTRLEDQTLACPTPGWVDLTGDCHDSAVDDADPAAQVHPGQVNYFGVGYPDVNQPLGISFDYDCSNGEEADPTNSPPGRVACGTDFTSCSGAGYRDGTRTGTGIDSLCGSSIIGSCQFDGSFACSSTDSVTDSPYRCR